MKTILAVAALVFAFSLPARAQVAGGGGGNTRLTGGGSSSGGSGGLGPVSMRTTGHIPSTQFQVSGASGSSTDFIPSAYVSYDKAVQLGQTILTTKPTTIVQAAQTNKDAKTRSTEYVITQDLHGNLVEESR
jgi:hypothetical protein